MVQHLSHFWYNSLFTYGAIRCNSSVTFGAIFGYVTFGAIVGYVTFGATIEPLMGQ